MSVVSTKIESSALRMLSPPLSPSPELKATPSVAFCKSYSEPLPGSAGGAVKRSYASTEPTTPTSSETPGAPAQKRMVTCWDSLLSDPVKYYRRELNFLDLYSLSRAASYAGYSEPTEARSARRRARPAARQTSDLETVSDSVLTRSRVSSLTPAASAAASATDDDERASSPKPRSPAGKKRSAALASRVHEMSYSQIEDYSPPTSLLPPGRSLRADWKGAPMDLSGDPDLHLLHPAEAHLASVLRLPADVYLDSKRRMFAEKVHRLRQGLAFRRTDSQKACRIDVNKASRLFGAFEKVGWLEDDLFVPYL